VAGGASAHVALAPDQAQEILATIARHQDAARAYGGDPRATEALFGLGEAVTGLVEMLNQDLVAHGEVNLFGQMLVRRLQSYSITVTFSPREKRYAYDLAAFEEYLKRAAGGTRAADAKFSLIAAAFRRTTGPDPAALVNVDAAGLQRAIAAEERFLRDHPGHDKGPEVRFFLAVDCYRAFRSAADPARARDYGARARRELERVRAGSPGSMEARAAEVLLERLDGQ